MKNNYEEILFKILKKRNFKKMVQMIKEREEQYSDSLLGDYCEIIYKIGVSKAYRNNIIITLESKIQDDDELEIFKRKIKEICDVYREYINIIINFLANTCNKIAGNERMYTELDDGVEEFQIV